MNWRHKIKIKHLLDGEDQSYGEVQKIMNNVADVLNKHKNILIGFSIDEFRNIPRGDNYFTYEDYANRLLERLYDFADANRIWIY